MLRSKTVRAKVYQWKEDREPDIFERLRYAAACKLCSWHEHRAGGGSCYITVAESLKLRFSNHENTSAQYREPDFNFVNRDPTEHELREIIKRIQYPRLCKKAAFAIHIGLTVPKLTKLLNPGCYEDVYENLEYPYTLTKYVVVATALETVDAAGVSERIPVRQERCSEEDYSGS